MEFRILGPVEAVHDGARLAIGGPRHRRLLAFLLLHAGTVVSTGRLIDALWATPPPRSAGQMVHVRMSELRTALRTGQPELRRRHGRYLFRIDGEQLDAQRFERLVGTGSEALGDGDHAGARNEFEAALARCGAGRVRRCEPRPGRRRCRPWREPPT